MGQRDRMPPCVPMSHGTTLSITAMGSSHQRGAAGGVPKPPGLARSPGTRSSDVVTRSSAVVTRYRNITRPWLSIDVGGSSEGADSL